jgi:hypothetical protein
MKLLDIFSGYTATTGSVFVHLAYLVACSMFTFPILNKGRACSKWLKLIDQWFLTHLSFVIVLFLKRSFFRDSKELQFFSILFAILNYQSMILKTTIEHINYALDNNLPFFYVEDIVHYLVYLEIMTFAANLITNIVIVAIASYINVKMIKNGITQERRRNLELNFAQREVIENYDAFDGQYDGYVRNNTLFI